MEQLIQWSKLKGRGKDKTEDSIHFQVDEANSRAGVCLATLGSFSLSRVPQLQNH